LRFNTFVGYATGPAAQLAVDAASNRSQEHQDVCALVPFSYRVLDSGDLSGEAFASRKQLPFLFRYFREIIFHNFGKFLHFYLDIYPRGVG